MEQVSTDWTKPAHAPMGLSMGAEPAETIKSRRLTRDDWLAAARKIFVKSGIDDVKVDRLAKVLKASRGSFYWHFKSHGELLQALLQDWEVRNQVVISQTRDRWELSPPDMGDIGLIFLRENPIWLNWEVNWASQGLAMRLWARKSKAVGAAVLRVDRLWHELLRDLFVSKGYSEKESLVRARIIYFHYLGYYAFVSDEMLEEAVGRLVQAVCESRIGELVIGRECFVRGRERKHVGIDARTEMLERHAQRPQPAVATRHRW